MQLQERTEPAEAVAGHQGARAVRNGTAGDDRRRQDGKEDGQALRQLQAINEARRGSGRPVAPSGPSASQSSQRTALPQGSCFAHTPPDTPPCLCRDARTGPRRGKGTEAWTGMRPHDGAVRQLEGTGHKVTPQAARPLFKATAIISGLQPRGAAVHGASPSSRSARATTLRIRWFW